MLYKEYSFAEHGFVGHLVSPGTAAEHAVIVIMGGEKSIFPGKKIAERFADYGICGLAVSLFGAEGIPDTVDHIPLEMFGKAVQLLKSMGFKQIDTYGMSMGSIFAALTSIYYQEIENVILVSPTHVPFEGTSSDKKLMSGRSVVTYNGQDLQYVKADFTRYKASKYIKSPDAEYKVMGMWQSFCDAYRNSEREMQAMIPYEKMDANILMIAGDKDEAWPSAYSVRKIEKHLKNMGYNKKVKAVIYPNVGHLTGMMTDRKREKGLYRILPVIGVFYKTLGKYKKENMEAFQKAEKEIIDFIKD